MPGSSARILAPLAAALLGVGAASAQLSDAGCPGHLENASAEATWYTVLEPNACVLPLAPGALVAAVATADWNGSASCGRCLRVTGPLGSAVVQVVDQCPGCAAGDLDLGLDAFSAIADPGDGRVGITWQTVACDVAGPVSFVFDPGSDAFDAVVQVRNARYAVASLEVRPAGSETWVGAPRTSDGRFTFGASQVPVPFSVPFDFRVTDVHGAAVEEAGIPETVGTELPGSGQLPFCPEPGPGPAGAGAAAALAALARRPGRGPGRAQLAGISRGQFEATVPPSTSNTFPVTHAPAGEHR
jgi:expansin (peptidoglycan-binding protein)